MPFFQTTVQRKWETSQADFIGEVIQFFGCTAFQIQIHSFYSWCGELEQVLCTLGSAWVLMGFWIPFIKVILVIIFRYVEFFFKPI